MEAEEDIQTRYEIFAALQQERDIITTKGAGHLVVKAAWERVDARLGRLNDLDGIASLVDTETQL